MDITILVPGIEFVRITVMVGPYIVHRDITKYRLNGISDWCGFAKILWLIAAIFTYGEGVSGTGNSADGKPGIFNTGHHRAKKIGLVCFVKLLLRSVCGWLVYVKVRKYHSGVYHVCFCTFTGMNRGTHG